MANQFLAGLEKYLSGFNTKFFLGLESARASMHEEILAEAETKQTGIREEILTEVKAKRMVMKAQLNAELEATREMLRSQLITEAARTLMGEKNSGELAVVVPVSMSAPVSARIEEALTDVSGQLQVGFETALEAMSNTTQLPVDGVHLRMAEIEWSIRSLWSTMAAERVNPRQGPQEAIGARGNQSR